LSPRETALRVLMARAGHSRGDVFAGAGSGSDRALAETLVSGTTKWRRLLDELVGSYSVRGLSSLAPRVLWALRLGVFQLLFMGIPPHAAVSTTVDLLPRQGERSFVNGVLRTIARSSGHVELPSLDEDPTRYAALRFSYPEWIARLFIERFGVEDGLRLCDFGNRPPSLTLRVNRLRTSPEELLRRLRGSGVAVEPGPFPEGLTLLKGTGVTSLPGFDEGEFVVQDASATLVSLTTGARPGEAVWDACAAPGGKTTHLAEMMEGSGRLLATDIDASRAGMVSETLSRTGFDFAKVLTSDATDPSLESGLFRDGFDRILVDAPCSGLGVLRRNPDLRWNRRESDIGPMSARQGKLLSSAKRHLRVGGVLVYSTCTLTKEENEDTWLQFLSREGDMLPEDPADTLAPEYARMLSSEPFAGPGYRYVLPHRSGSDGFFIARARRISR
jgi:16S rRNA (cytosine967-C5)-methyltransferase